MDDMMERLFRVGAVFALMVLFVVMLLYMGAKHADLAVQQARENRDREMQQVIAATGLRLPKSAKMDDVVQEIRGDEHECWALIVVSATQTMELRQHLGQTSASGGPTRKVIQDNDLALDALRLPTQRRPAWWYDPVKVSASIVTVVEDNGATVSVTYLGFSYATGQIYLCQWRGPGVLWRNRPDLAPSTRPSAAPIPDMQRV